MTTIAGDSTEPRGWRYLTVGSTYRYAKPGRPQDAEIDGLPNWYWVTGEPGRAAFMLESGINGTKPVQVVDGRSRRPAVFVRSSPWKAGSTWTPWHDVFDLDQRHVRYFGDSKVGSRTAAHETPGNKLLTQLAGEHGSEDLVVRARSAPVLVLRSVRASGREKGQVEFCGVAVVAGREFVRQPDPTSGAPFDNYAFDLALIDLAPEGGRLDLRWIWSRRSPTLSDSEVLEFAPAGWRRWVRTGDVAPVETDGDVEAVLEEIDELASPSGQGPVLDGGVRRAIEKRAMDATTAHFHAQGWLVHDVSAVRSYDLEITKDGMMRRVEVKGTQSTGSHVLLTANEVRHAYDEYPKVILSIVSGIQLHVEPNSEQLTGSGGTLRIFDPLDLGSGSLKPTTYVYAPPR